MERQIILNMVVTHARKQGKKAKDGGFSLCRYRADDGSRCFFGCLIPDELYRDDMEGKMLVGVDINAEIFQPVFDHLEVKDPGDICFLRNLQIIHDGREISEWENSFKIFAERYSLTVPSIA